MILNIGLAFGNVVTYEFLTIDEGGVHADVNLLGDYVLYAKPVRPHSYARDLFLYNIKTGITKQITFDGETNGSAYLKDGYVVWSKVNPPGSEAPNNSEIYLYDIAEDKTTRITNNTYRDEFPRLDNGYVVWIGWVRGHHLGDVFLYNIESGETTQITNITDNNVDAQDPRIDGQYVVWQEWDVTNYPNYKYNIFLYDIERDSIIPVTNDGDGWINIGPLLNDGIVAFTKGYGLYWEDSTEVYIYDIESSQTKRVTENDYPDMLGNLNQGFVAWNAEIGRGSYYLYLYDIINDQVTRITDDRYFSSEIQIDNGKIVWVKTSRKGGPSKDEIFLYDIAKKETIQVSDKSNRPPDEIWIDQYPQISNEIILFNRNIYYQDVNQVFIFKKSILYLAVPVIQVTVDIKPQSCPNPLNTKSQGVLPVAILGLQDFDVTQIDVSSVHLIGVAPLRSNFRDVATPFNSVVGKQGADACNDLGCDGFIDLVLKFDTQEVVAALGEVANGDVLVLTLTGQLQEQFGGTKIRGEDVVVIRKKGKK